MGHLMMGQLVIVVDASQNLNKDRQFAVNGIAKTILMSMPAANEFALVIIRESIEGYQTGRFRPSKESSQALVWLRSVAPMGVADFSLLLRRLIYLPEPVQVLLLACGSIGRDSELLRLAELAPDTLCMWGLALDENAGQLKSLCRLLRGNAYSCDPLEYQRALQQIPIARAGPLDRL